jgi:glycosyltransferase involved in cell wall biosynthesis
MPGMKRRLLLLTEIIAPYRIPVFNVLAQQPGINLHVIFLSETDPDLRQWLVYKDEISFSYEVLRSWRWRSADRSLLLNFGLSKAIKRASPDIVICGGYNYPASWHAMQWSRRERVPFLLWVESTSRDQRSHYRFIEQIKTRFLQRCDAFIVPGRASSEYLRNYGVFGGNIFTAPNAVDIKLFARLAKSARESAAWCRSALQMPGRFFLFVGRLVKEKGVFDLLEAYKQMCPELREEIGVVFVGDGAACVELSRRAASIVPGTVQFAGYVQRDKLASYYALAEALVFPTQTDPWGLVVNEAMACGLPVISSDAAGCAADLIENNWNGWMVQSGKITQLTRVMSDMVRNPHMRDSMGVRSWERIQDFSPEACAKGIARAVAVSGARA